MMGQGNRGVSLRLTTDVLFNCSFEEALDLKYHELTRNVLEVITQCDSIQTETTVELHVKRQKLLREARAMLQRIDVTMEESLYDF